jgi:phosphatidylinositol 4-kinase
MRLPEFEALLSLCQAAPFVTNIETAAQLLAQLTSYLPESHTQNLSVPVPTIETGPSPWEVLTNSLSSSVLSLGLNHPSLRHHAARTINQYIMSWLKASRACNSAHLDSKDEDDEYVTELVSQTVILAVSMVGLLNAATEHPTFWSPDDRLQLVNVINEGLSDTYLTALETSLSVIRNSRQTQGDLKMWKLYSRRYATNNRPLGAMLLRLAFIQLLSAFAALEVGGPTCIKGFDVLDHLLVGGQGILSKDQVVNVALVEKLTDISADELKLLEEGSDYLELGSAYQQRLASSVKAHSLTTLLCCSILDEDIADPEALLVRLENTMSSPILALDENLAAVVFKSIAILSKFSPSVASNVSRSLSRIIVQGGLDSKTASVAAQSLASILTKLPQDATITTLYSLGNVLSAAGTRPERNLSTSPTFENTKTNRGTMYAEPGGGSVISLGPSGEEPSLVYLTTIEAIVTIACTCGEDKIIALALSMLVQKLSRLTLEVDAKIIVESAVLGVHSAPGEFKSLLKFYARICHEALLQENYVLLDAVMRARLYLAQGIKRGSDLFETYLIHLLDAIVSKGDAPNGDGKHLGDVELASQEIAQLLRPLAAFASANYNPDSDDLEIDGLLSLQRDAWFNSVVHGFTFTSPLGKKYRAELLLLAQYSHPLIAEDRADHLESDIELNTTLRRGKSNDHTNEYRKQLIEALPECESDIRSISYSELVFLTSSYMVENLRAMAGDCTYVLKYFLDPRLKSGPLANCMFQVAISAVKTYLTRTISGKGQSFSAPYVARQLALFFAGCCHRISKVQSVAQRCADLILVEVPSALCYKSSLFALFELLSIMWVSCLEQDTEEYEWRSNFNSKRGNVNVELSDNYALRRQTLVNLHKWARVWIERVVNIAPLDIKGLIQTYLSEYEDDGASYNISLGRSFALEMGGMIPMTDQRLGAIDNQVGVRINTASDLIAQYTTRQEYRFVGGDRGDEPWLNGGGDVDLSATRARKFKQSVEDAKRLLSDIESRTTNHQFVSFSEIRDVLRRAGALLCRTGNDEGALVHHLVGVPFAVFTKQAINLGISLWTGVLKENARMESRILAEIAECWEESIRKRRGLFDRKLHELDPFLVKLEFAPSDQSYIMKHEKLAQELITPHLRLLQFFCSHCSASRLGAPHIQRIYQRLVNVTLIALRNEGGHPLAREAHFYIIYLGLRILRFSGNLEPAVLWRFKDRLLTAALSWFSFQPKWSFGGNRLQIKAETHILSDVYSALDRVKHIGLNQSGTRKSLQPKQDLLSLLIANEQTRLTVWLFPLENEKKHHLISVHQSKAPTDAFLATCLKTAWAENPALAVQLSLRFQSTVVTNALRFLLLSFPEKVLNNYEAAEILLGQAYPIDVTYQLKYLLYWDCVNPMSAVAYFLPAFGSNPFVIQYAVRALEAHSIDTNFFYVPQIVQTLRYDDLGYIERYIIETAKFSQLFAHQIIWNMKANAYKDEDSQIVSSFVSYDVY